MSRLIARTIELESDDTELLNEISHNLKDEFGSDIHISYLRPIVAHEALDELATTPIAADPVTGLSEDRKDLVRNIGEIPDNSSAYVVENTEFSEDQDIPTTVEACGGLETIGTDLVVVAASSPLIYAVLEPTAEVIGQALAEEVDEFLDHIPGRKKKKLQVNMKVVTEENQEEE